MEDYSTYFKRYYVSHKEEMIANSKRSYQENREKILERRNSEKYKEHMRNIQKSVRIKLIEILGGKCSNPKCLVSNGCEDIRCLQIDHIHGGGTNQLRTHGSYSVMKYYLNHLNEARADLQILCANCNWIKRAELNETKLGWKKKKDVISL